MSGFTTRPEITGTFGVASSTHWLASQTALSVLERGGNAFDAAVAGAFVLQIVEPQLNGPGGEAPILLWDEARRGPLSINGQGPAPHAATINEFRRRGLGLVPGIGLLAATVPGAFGAWMTLLRDHGTWRLEDVLAPAIGYAESGFPVSRRLCESILSVRGMFLEEWTSSADVWLVNGRVPVPGSLHTLPALAATYRKLVEVATRSATKRVEQIDAALDAWYRGFVAREIDAFCRKPVRDSSGERNSGLLTADDMAHWQPAVESPVTARYGRFTLAKCGFWSQGPTFLQMLGALGGDMQAQDACDSPEFVHRVVESAKLAFADRLAWYGSAPSADPRTQQALLSAAYAGARAGQIASGRASVELRPGHPLGWAPRLPRLDATDEAVRSADLRFGIGEPTFATLPPVADWADRELFVGDTCHIDVIDRHGNMVAATPSGGWLASSPAVPALGFALGTRLQMTWLDEGLPNSLTPGVAPCTTLSPSLALRDDEPYLAFGTPGGDQQDQWSVAFFLRHAVLGMNLQEAIDAPSFHVKHYPASFWPRPVTLNRLHVESRFPSQTLDQLRSWGHEVVVGDAWSESRMCACSRLRDGRGRLVLRAAANPRGMQGYAVGR